MNFLIVNVFVLTTLLSGPVWAVKAPHVVIIAYNGFSYEYLDNIQSAKDEMSSSVTSVLSNTPFLMSAANSGACAVNGIKPSFVTRSTSAMYTLATGLYQESHGVVGDRMWDPKTKEEFTPSSTDPKWWKGGEPIWITAVKNKLKSAVVDWPGSNVTLDNRTATIVEGNPTKQNLSAMADKVSDWIIKDNINIIMLYFPEPFKSISAFSEKEYAIRVKAEVRGIDADYEAFVVQLQKRGIYNTTDIIFVGDRGIVPYCRGKVVDISSIIDLDNFDKIVEEGGFFSCYPKQDKLKYVNETLSNPDYNMEVYLKDKFPSYFRYRDNERVPPLLIMADEGYSIVSKKYTDSLCTGIDGYDNHVNTTRTIFVATGPDFKSGGYRKEEIFDTVDVYPMLCQILNIAGAPNNGSLDNVADMMRQMTPAGRRRCCIN